MLFETLEPRSLLAVDLVSSSSAGVIGNGLSDRGPVDHVISGDGRYVVFNSRATNLVPSDTNGMCDVFVKDRQAGVVTRVSTDGSGNQANGDSFDPTISADGRYVAFYSLANNLISGDTNGQYDIFVKDLQTGSVARASTSSSGAQSNGSAYQPSLSGDGRYVAFWSEATNLVTTDTNSIADVFVKDLQTGTLSHASTDSSGNQANGFSTVPAISADGRFVVFRSDATNLVPGDTNGRSDIFRKDLQNGTLIRVTSDSAGTQGNGDTYYSALSGDGRYVAFWSYATNLVPGDTNGGPDVFVKDTITSAVERVSTDSSGSQGNSSSFAPSISADGRFVAFHSYATNFVSGDTNSRSDLFVKDRATGALTYVGVPAFADGDSYSPGIDGTGSFVSFVSYATNLAAGDTNNTADIFATNVPSIAAVLDGSGNLTIVDANSIGKNHDFVVRVSGSDLVIEDRVESFLSAPSGGSLTNSGRTLTLPLASVTGTLTIAGAGGVDNVALEALPGFLGSLSLGTPLHPVANVSTSGAISLVAGKALSAYAASIATTNGALSTSGGAINLNSTGDIFLNAPLDSQGGPLGLNADSDGNGSGTLTLAATVLSSWSQTANLVASTGVATEGFGRAVAISADGTTAVMGVSYDDNGGNDRGSAYVFVRTSSFWIQQGGRLQASDGVASDEFGNAVAISADGNTVLIGVQQDDVGGKIDQGSAYVFKRSGPTWTQQGVSPLTASDGIAGDGFGCSVALSADGKVAVIGSPGSDVGAANRGSAYVFTYDGSTWSQVRIDPVGASANDVFGRAVSISSDGATVLLSSHRHDVPGNIDQGAAYVFSRTVWNAWAQQAVLTNPGGAGGDFFGYSVALSGDGNTALVGSYTDDSVAVTRPGVAHIFVRSGNSWAHQSQLIPAGAANDDVFGSSVALSSDGNTALVSAYHDDLGANANQGSAYVFRRAGSAWSQSAQITAPDGAANDWFGNAVSISGDGRQLLIGAYFDDVAGKVDQGSAYVFNYKPGDAGGSIAAGAGPISIAAADTFMANTVSSTASVSIAPEQSGQQINLGLNVVGTLSLNDAELDQIATPSLLLGNSSSGTVTVGDTITRPATTSVEITSGQDILISGGLFNTRGGQLRLAPGSTGAIRPTYLGASVVANPLTIAPSSNLAVSISGTVAGSQYSQLFVGGSLDLTGVNLVLEGAYVPGPADTFQIVSATNNITGTFNGLPQGAPITFNGKTLYAKYTSNSVYLDGPPPVVTGITPSPAGGVLPVGTGSLQIAFSEGIFGGANTANFELRNHGADGLLGNADDQLVPLSLSYSANTSTLTFAPLGEGVYRLTVRDTIIDGSNALDGNGDGYPGGSYVRDFVVNSFPTLDSTFDGDGKVTTGFGTTFASADDVAVQSDGKILVAGRTYNGTVNSFALARYNADGSLDTSFDSDGRASPAFGGFNAVENSIAVQSDGRIIVAGYAFNGGNYDFALARFNTNGTLDTTFDSDGKVTIAFGPGDDLAFDVALQSDGKIVVAGYTVNGGDRDFAIARLNTNGSLDNTFDSDGKATLSRSVNDNFNSLAIQSDGKIIAAGVINSSLALVRFAPNGSLDTTFDGDGIVTTTLAGASSFLTSVGVQADGKIVAAGTAVFPGVDSHDFALARYLPNGLLDTTFDSDGIVVTPIGSANDDAYDLAIQSNAKIWVAGTTFNGTNYDIALARYEPSGAPDSTFDGDGKLLLPFGSSQDSAYGVTLQGDGKLLAVGDSYNGTATEFAVARLDLRDPVNLTSSHGLLFDIDRAGAGAGQFLQGSANTFDGASRLVVNGVPMSMPAGDPGHSDDSGQTFVTAAANVGGLVVQREITVPATGAPDFARTVEVFTNPTLSAITIPVTLTGNLGSDAATTVFATSDGDNNIAASDRWIGTDDADGSGTPAVIHYIHGPQGLQPTNVQVVGDNVTWSYNLTVPAGQTVRLASFTVLNQTRAGAVADAQALATDTAFGGQAAAFLSPAELNSLANFSFGTLSATLDSFGNLAIADVGAGDIDNQLTVTRSGVNLVVSDAHEQFIVAPSGGVLSNNNQTLTMPLASVLGAISIQAGNGNDQLTVDLAGGNVIPMGSITYNGGSQTLVHGDSLVIAGGNQGTVTYNYHNPFDGHIIMSNYGMVAYTSLEPIANTGTANDIIFELPSVRSNDAVLEDDGIIGNGLSRLRSADGRFETTTFASPSGSVTIHRGHIDDALTVSALPDLHSALTIGAAAEPFKAVAMAGAITFSEDKSAAITANAIQLNAASADLALSGVGSVQLNAAETIGLVAGASISAVEGNIELNANQGVSSAQGDFVGIDLAGAVLQSTGHGNIILNGRGGEGTGNSKVGVRLASSVLSASGGGSLTVVGQGGGQGDFNYGVLVDDSAVVSGGGAAEVTLHGEGGVGADRNYGVVVSWLAHVSAADGPLGVTGIGHGSGAENCGIVAYEGGTLSTTGSGALTLTATAATGTALNLATSAAVQTAGSGNLSISADSLAIDATATISSSGALAQIHPATAGLGINLGGADSPSALGLADSELDRITATLLLLGDGTSGPITISAPTSPASVNALHLITRAGVSESAPLAVSNLAVTANAAVALGLTTNDVTTLAIATTGGFISFGDQNGLTIGTVDGVAGVTTSSGSVNLYSTGSLTLTDTSAPYDVAGTASITFFVDSASGQLILQPGSATRSTGGDHYYVANKINIAGTIDASGQKVTLRPLQNSQAINLGSTSDSLFNTLELSDAELDRVTARVLEVGMDTSTSPISITQAISPAGTDTLHLVTGGTVGQVFPAGIVETNLAVSAGGSVILTVGQNNIGTLAVHAITGNINYSSNSGVTVGEVASVAGLHADGGEIRLLTTSGNVTVSDTSATSDVQAAGLIDVNLRGDEALFTLASGANILSTAGTTQFYTADKMDLQGTISGAGQQIALLPAQTGQPMELGASTNAAANLLELSAAELQHITADTLRIGNASAGNITITQPISPTPGTTLALFSGGNVAQVSAGAIVAPNLAVRAGSAVALTAGGNNVGMLAIRATTGNVQYSSNVGVTVGEVFGVPGLGTGSGEIRLLTLTGNVTIANTSAANDVEAAGMITITLRGDDALLTVASGANILSSADSLQFYTADKMDLQGTISGVGQQVVLVPSEIGQPIALGSASNAAANQLELSDAELNHVTAATLRIGSGDAGPITISQAISPAGAGTLALINVAPISEVGSGSIAAANLAIRAGGAVTLNGGNSVTALGIQTTSGSIQFANTSNLTITSPFGVPGVHSNNGDLLISTSSGNIDVQAGISTNLGSVQVRPTSQLQVSAAISGTAAIGLSAAQRIDLLSGSVVSTSGAITIDLLPDLGAGGTVALAGVLIGSSPTLVRGSASTDQFDLQASASFADGLNIQGGAANDTLTSYSANPTTWNLASTNAGSIFGLSGPVAFSSVESLVSGNGNDLFLLAAGAGLTGTLIASAGTDTLDYSAYTTAVTASLLAGTATATGGISGFENLIGGSAADSLTGDDGPNTLVGNAGNDTLIASGGNDALTGGAGNDALRGGTGDDTYYFDADSPLNTDTFTEVSGIDTLDFSATLLGIAVNLATPGNQTVNANLVINLGSAAALENVIGGSGNDTLTDNTLANLLIGADGNDSYVFGPSAAAQTDTVVEYPLQGTDLLNFSALASTDPLTANLASATTLLASHTNRTLLVGIAGQASNFENVNGGAGADVLVGNDADNVLTGNGGNDTLTGGRGANTLTGGAGTDTLSESRNTDFTLSDTLLSASDASTSVLATLEIAQLAGGSAANLFNITGWSGSGSLVGNGGNDRAVAQRNANFVLSDASLSIGSDVWSLAGITIADLTGGTGNNSFTISGWTGAGSIGGDAGTDTLVAAKDAGFVLQNSSVTATDGLQLSLNSLETANLTGGGSDDGFDLRAWTGDATIVGGNGTDLIQAERDANFTLTNTSLAITGFPTWTLSGIERANLAGGAAANTFTVSGWTGAGALVSNGGADAVIASKNTDFVLASAVLTSSDGMTLGLTGIGIASLTGGAAANAFIVSGWTGSGTITGAGGADTLSVAKNADFILTSSSLVATDGLNLGLATVEVANLTGGSASNLFDIGGWVGTGALIGGGGSDTVIANRNANFTLTDSSLAASSGPNVSLSGIATALLTGGASANTFTVSGWTGLGALSGGGGNDTVAAAKDRDFVLANTMLSAADGLQLTLSSVEIANLTGGAGDNSFLVSDWTGSGLLTGGGGLDALRAAKNASFTLTNTSFDSSDGLSLVLSAIARAELTSGAGNTVFDVAGWTGTGALTAGGLALVSAARDTNFTLTDSALAASDGMSLSLSGVALADLAGGAGNNVLDARGFTGPVTLDGDDGNDKLFGGTNNDTLTGGAGNDLLVAGAGNDQLFGNAGRDFLIGGLGGDSLEAGGDDDILVAGTTAYDADQAALDAILAEWTSADNYATRITKLRQGVGLNGSAALRVASDFGLGAPTVFGDASLDTLRGRAGLDWFFASLASDLVADRSPSTETLGAT